VDVLGSQWNERVQGQVELQGRLKGQAQTSISHLEFGEAAARQWVQAGATLHRDAVGG
jgi:hypothetical protein